MISPMGWKKGDLGRFKAEDSKQPRFEVIGVNKARTNIGVWYGGLTQVQTIPIDSFRKDVVNWWEHECLSNIPRWVRAGAVFQLAPKGRHLRQAMVMGRNRWDGFHTHTIDAGSESLKIRSVRFDFVSCSLNERKLVVPLPIKHLMVHGFQEKTAWDRLDEDPFNDEDEDLLLFHDT